MDLCHLSAEYFVRKLTDSDIDMIYDLSRGNCIFYRYHPPFVSKESILKDMQALPPAKGYDDKFYIGFFKNEKLVAVMDIICDYPGDNVLFIGLFMMDQAFQGQGIGTRIIDECCSYWKSLRYRKVQLGVDKGNPQSNAFWRKNHFSVTNRRDSTGTHDIVLMERTL